MPAYSVAALVYAYGWRWNNDGVWQHQSIGEADPDTELPYTGPPEAAVLAPGERVIVDEAGMLDQDTALALLHVADERKRASRWWVTVRNSRRSDVAESWTWRRRLCRGFST